jgi:ABC-type polysaccharide/polyol phosphate export permease
MLFNRNQEHSPLHRFERANLASCSENRKGESLATKPVWRKMSGLISFLCATEWRLKSDGAGQEMLRQFAAIWRYRSFWLSLVYMDLCSRYRRSLIGIGWTLLTPLLMTVVFCVVFGAWFKNPDWRNYGPYFLAGLTIFGFVRDSVTAGCHTFFKNESFIRQCPLPLAVYTLRTVLGAGIHFLIGLAVVLLAVLVLLPDLRLPILQIAWVFVPALVLLFIFCWSISVLASLISVYFHDTAHLSDVIFQVLFFLTPIVFPVSMMVDRGLTILLSINPVVAFLEIIRTPLLSGQVPPAWAFAKAMIVTTIAAGAATAAMAWLQKKLIFHL